MSPSDETESVRLRAHAKLTLSLRVRGRRHDGYHDLEALAVSVADLSDEVEVALVGEPEVTLQMTGTTEGVPTDASNLTVRAARLMLSRVEPGAGARLALRKAIPAGAGLGGGSADAAAVLHGVAGLRPAEAEGIDLAAIGAQLGSDVPFCVTGGGACLRGRGEIVEPLDVPDGWWAVVAVPPLAVATAEVYAAWDALGGPRADRVVAPPAPLQGLLDALTNDLEPAALQVEPRLVAFRDRVEAAAGRPPVLAGSGSAYFVVLDDEGEARALAAEVAGFSAVAVATTAGSAGVTPVSW